ncbi:TVP38/TMEM64 family protein [Saccharospirillum salsuginis]|uniref:TVP38/TMEM64 family membrane protein n=1 Tax=Saccharospirillum salsuginis TaxID=418750 RepID=A0A918NB09_9GAMM|nr:VTT domain-containing protein [Saccharospirillum salsuginis]GGX54836.1 TVP38/TMEM64 family protein [Saccharospirillum salsuginis]
MKRAGLLFWGLAIAFALYLYAQFLVRDLARTVAFFSWLAQSQGSALIVLYVAVLCLRGLLLIPSTPLLFIGIALFPPWLAYALNMIGILASSWLVILAVRHMSLGPRLERKLLRHPKADHIKRQTQKYGLPVVIGWSFFPFAPTDLIVYIGTLVRIRTASMLSGVMIGEAVLNAIYVFGGHRLLAELSTVEGAGMPPF